MIKKVVPVRARVDALYATERLSDTMCLMLGNAVACSPCAALIAKTDFAARGAAAEETRNPPTWT